MSHLSGDQLPTAYSYHPEVNWIPHWSFLCPKNIHLFDFWPPSSAQCFGGRKWLKALLMGNPSPQQVQGRFWGAFQNTRGFEAGWLQQHQRNWKQLKAVGLVPDRTNSIWRIKNVCGGHQPVWSSFLTWKWRQSKTLHCFVTPFSNARRWRSYTDKVCYPTN